MKFQMRDLKRMSFWGRLVGNIGILYGILLIIKALVSTIIGVVAGIVIILVGMLIHNIGEEAEKLVLAKGNNARSVNLILQKISRYLLILAILIFSVIAFYILYISVLLVIGSNM